MLTWLSFSACTESEFNCDDGSWYGLVEPKCHQVSYVIFVYSSLPLYQRCDGIMHCPDRSDEMNCEKILTGPAYLKTIPPPPEGSGITGCVMSVS